MIHFVLASHGRFAQEALASARMICGLPTGNFHVISLLDGGEGINRFETEAKELAAALENETVLLLADLFGAGPFMTLLSAFRDNNYKMLTGLNLPMVIEAMQCDDADLEEAAQNLLEAGKESGIQLLDKLVPEEETE